MKLLTYWKVILALTVVALCGGAIGAALALRIQNQRLADLAGGGLAAEASTERHVNYLQLTSAQQEKVRPALERGQNEIRAIVTSAVAQTVQARKRLEAEVRPLLTPEQIQRLDQMVERRERARERWQSGEQVLPGTPEQRERLRERLQDRRKAQTNQVPATSRPN
jgi:hypothetical protein